MAKKPSRQIDHRLAAVRAALEEGRPDDALMLADAIIAARPRDAHARNLAGIAAFQSGDAKSARRHLEAALALAPNEPDIHMNLGNVLGALDDLEGALAAYAAAGEGAEPAYNAGLLLMRARRYGEARAAFERASATANHPAAELARAEAFRLEGRPADAKDALLDVTARRPEDAAGFVNLSAALQELGDAQGAKTAAETAGRLQPGMHEAHFNLGVALQALGDHQGAVERYRRVLALEPGHAAAALNQGEAARAIGDNALARRAFERALDIDPLFAKAAVNLADLDVAAGNLESALATVERFLERRPGQPLALAHKAAILWEAGKDDAAKALLGLDTFIRVIDIEPPPGFADIATFNDALAGHIRRHPTLTPSPASHATRHGRHSGELLAPPLGPIEQLAQIIRNAAAVYIADLAIDRTNPFSAGRPEAPNAHLDLSIWGVIMTRDGHQVPHIHPSAWLCGVYYAAVPIEISEEDPTRSGWIEFGRQPDEYAFSRPPIARPIRPIPGRLVLFPSHLHHRTIPLSVECERISIAFDAATTT